MRTGTDKSSNYTRITNEEIERDLEPEAKTGNYGKPFVDQTPVQALSRWRQTRNGTLGSAGTLVYNVLTDLLEDVVVKALLRSFVYIRTDMEVKIVTTCPIQYYGTLKIVHLPFYPVVTLGQSVSHTVCSIEEHYTMDLATQNELIFSVPWSSPLEWISLLNPQDKNVMAGMFKIYLSLPFDVKSIDDTVAPTIPFQMYLRFKNLQTQAFVFDNALPEYLVGEAQMGDQVRLDEDLQLPERDIIPVQQGNGYATRAAVGTGLLGAAYTGTQIIDWINSMFGSGPGKDGVTFLKGKKSSAIPPVKQSQWGELLGQHEIDADLTTIGDPEQGKLPLIYLLKKWTSFLFLSSVSTSLTVIDVVHPNPVAVFTATGKGLPVYSRLAYWSQFFRYWRGGIKYKFEIIASPLVTYKLRFTVTWNQNTGTLSSTPGDRFVHEVTVRGTTTTEFMVPYLCALQYSSTWYQYASDNAEKIPSLVSTFNGRYPVLAVNLLTAPRYTGTTTPEVYLICYKAAYDDFQFMSIKDPRPKGAPEGLEGEAQSGQVMFGKSDLSKSSRREGEYLDDIIDRWYAVNPNKLQPGTLDTVELGAYAGSDGGSATPDPLDSISLHFMWRVGPLDYKAQFPPKPGTPSYSVSALLSNFSGQTEVFTTGAYYPPPFSRTGDGATRLNTVFADVLEFSAPMVCSFPFVAANSYITNQYAPGTGVVGFLSPLPITLQGSDATSPVADEVLRRAGKGFHFLCDLPPPNVNFWYYCGTGDPTMETTKSVSCSLTESDSSVS